jgi:hypothetical protein
MQTERKCFIQIKHRDFLSLQLEKMYVSRVTNIAMNIVFIMLSDNFFSETSFVHNAYLNSSACFAWLLG